MKTIYIIMSFCFGLLIGYLLFKSRSHATRFNSFDAIKRENEKLKIIQLSKLYQDNRFRLLKDSLSAKTITLKNELERSKKEFLKAQQKVKQELLLLKMDSNSRQDMCFTDSLHFAIQNLNSQTDSLLQGYELQLKYHRSMVAIRDSEIVILNKSHTALVDLSREQALREQRLSEDLNTTLKALQKKRRQNRILAGGMLFMSGVITTIVIKSHQ